MTRTTLRALACALLLAACADKAERPVSAPAKPRGVAKPALTLPDTTAPGSDTEGLPEAEVFLKAREDQAQPTAADTPANQTAQAKRDLGAELKQAMSGAATCLKPRPTDTAPKSIEISMTAVVMPTGSVGRSEASSSALDAQEIACIRRQIEGVRFALPIENAPFSVSSVLRIDQAPPPVANPATPAPPAAPAPAVRTY